MHTDSTPHIQGEREPERSGAALLPNLNYTVIQSMYIFSTYNESSDMQKAAADFILADDSKDALFFLRQYTLPVIGVCGIFGNVLSAIIFLSSNHRHTSCSLYLAARSVMDTWFLVTLFIAWLDFIDIRIFHINGVCQITVFVSYVSSFMSVSFVVCITFENYIRICKPMNVNKYCTTKIAKRTILVLFGTGVVIYNFPLWATQVRVFHGNNQTYCLTLPQFSTFELGLTYTDTIVTLMVPFVIIVVLLLLIFYAAIEASKRQSRLRRQQSSEQNRSSSSPHNVVTRLLTLVSITFLLLHTPSHVIRIKVIIETIIGENSATTETDRHLQYVFLTLYYLNFSINCALYLLCCKQFRSAFITKMCIWKCNRYTVVTTTYNNFSEQNCENERFSNGITTAEIITERESLELTPFQSSGNEIWTTVEKCNGN